MSMEQGKYEIVFEANVNDVKSDLTDLEQSFKRFGANRKENSDKIERYIRGEAIKSVKDEKKAYKEATKAVKDEYEERYKAAKDNAIKLAQLHRERLKREEALEKEHSSRVKALRSQSTVGRAVNRFQEADTGGIGGKIAGVSAALGPIGSAAEALVSTFSEASKAAGDFEDGAIKISTLLDDTQAKALPAAMAEMRDIAKETGEPIANLQEGMYKVLSAAPQLANNLSAANSVLEKAAKAAKGLGTETIPVVDAMTNLGNAAGLNLESIDDQNKILDIMANTMKQGKMEATDLAAFIAKSAPSMAAVSEAGGEAVEAIGAMNAIMSSSGVNAEQTQTQITALANELLDTKTATKLAAAGMKGFDSETGKVSDWGELFKSMGQDVGKFTSILSSDQSQNAVRILAKNGGEAFQSMITSMQNAGGTADEMYQKMATSGENIDARLAAAWNDALITIGGGMDSLWDGVKEGTATALNWITGLFKSAEEIATETQAKANQAVEQSKMIAGSLSGFSMKIDVGDTEGALSAVRERLGDIGEIAPSAADRLREIMNTPGGPTQEGLKEIQTIMSDINDMAQAQAIVAASEAAEAGLEGIAENIENAFDKVGEGVGFIDSLRVTANDSIGAMQQLKTIQEDNVASLRESITSQKEKLALLTDEEEIEEAKAELNETQKELYGEMENLNRTKAGLASTEVALNETIANQLADIQAIDGANFDINEAKLRIQASLTDKLGEEEGTQNAINEALDAQISRMEEAKEAERVKLEIETEIESSLRAQGITEASTNEQRYAALQVLHAQNEVAINSLNNHIKKLQVLRAEIMAKMQSLSLSMQEAEVTGKLTPEARASGLAELNKMHLASLNGLKTEVQLQSKVTGLKKENLEIEAKMAKLKPPKGAAESTAAGKSGGVAGGGKAVRSGPSEEEAKAKEAAQAMEKQKKDELESQKKAQAEEERLAKERQKIMEDHNKKMEEIEKKRIDAELKLTEAIKKYGDEWGKLVLKSAESIGGDIESAQRMFLTSAQRLKEDLDKYTDQFKKERVGTNAKEADLRELEALNQAERDRLLANQITLAEMESAYKLAKNAQLPEKSAASSTAMASMGSMDMLNQLAKAYREFSEGKFGGASIMEDMIAYMKGMGLSIADVTNAEKVLNKELETNKESLNDANIEARNLKAQLDNIILAQTFEPLEDAALEMGRAAKEAEALKGYYDQIIERMAKMDELQADIKAGKTVDPTEITKLVGEINKIYGELNTFIKEAGIQVIENVNGVPTVIKEGIDAITSDLSKTQEDFRKLAGEEKDAAGTVILNVEKAYGQMELLRREGTEVNEQFTESLKKYEESAKRGNALAEELLAIKKNTAISEAEIAKRAREAAEAYRKTSEFRLKEVEYKLALMSLGEDEEGRLERQLIADKERLLIAWKTGAEAKKRLDEGLINEEQYLQTQIEILGIKEDILGTETRLAEMEEEKYRKAVEGLELDKRSAFDKAKDTYKQRQTDIKATTEEGSDKQNEALDAASEEFTDNMKQAATATIESVMSYIATITQLLGLAQDIMDKAKVGGAALAESVLNAGQGAADIAEKVSGLPIGKIFSGVRALTESILSIVSEIQLKRDAAYQVSLLETESLQNQLEIMEAMVSSLETRLEIESLLNEIIVTRADEGKEQVRQAAKEMRQYGQLMNNAFDSQIAELTASLDEMVAHRESEFGEKGFKGLWFDNRDILKIKKLQNELNDLNRAQNQMSVGGDYEKRLKQVPRVVEQIKRYSEEQERLNKQLKLEQEWSEDAAKNKKDQERHAQNANEIQARIDMNAALIENMKGYLRALKAIAVLERQNLQDSIDSIEFRKSMGKYDEDERGYLRDKMNAQRELLDLGLRQRDLGQITRQELRDLKLAWKGAKDELDAYKESQGELESSKIGDEFAEKRRQIEHEFRMDQIDEIKYKEQLIQLLKDQEQAMQVLVDKGLLKEKDLYDIQEERYALEKELLDLRMQGLDVNSEEYKQLQELHKLRQDMVLMSRTKELTQEERDRINAIENEIIAKMVAAGATPEAIQAAKEGFAEASYASGTPYVPKDMVAKIHKGERILTSSENRQFLSSINAMNSTLEGLSRGFEAIMALQAMKINGLRGGGDHYTITQNFAGVSDPHKAAELSVNKIEKVIRRYENRQGSANLR